jgi:hypothetical protein
VYCLSSKNILADTLFCREQDIGRQKALGKAHRTQVLLTPDKLNLKIVHRLPANLMPINSLKASVILTNSYIPLDLIDHIFTANKQSPSLADERAKAIRGNQN